MIRWAARSVRRALGAVALLLLLLAGAEVAIRLGELRTSRRLVVPRAVSPVESLKTPSWTSYHELRPLASLTVRDPQSSQTHVLRTNSFGLRGPEAAVPKPAEVYRVVCLGDEAVFAARCAEEDHFCGQLQHVLQQATKLRVEVWNAGIPGACPLTEFLLLRHRLALLQPDLVLVAVRESDLADDSRYRRHTRNDPEGNPLACKHPALGRKPRTDRLTAWREEFRLIDIGLNWAGDTWKRKTEFEHSLDDQGTLHDLARLRDDRTVIDRTLQPLIPMAAWCRNAYATLCVCEIRSAEAEAAAESGALFSTALQELAAEQKIAFMEWTRSPTTTNPGGRLHWSAADHQEFAQHLGRQLMAQTAGPWSSPYFRPDNAEITPISHSSRSRPPRLLQRNPAPNRR